MTKKNKKKVIYPKVDGERFDILRRRAFDELRENFAWTIKETLRDNALTAILKKEAQEKIADTIAWNCAYMVVTN